MKKIFLAFLILFLNQVFCQDKTDENFNKAYVEVFGKCFEDLKPIEGTKEILPSKKNISFCSLYQCVTRIEYAENNKDIGEKILKRAIEITIRLYNAGTPIYLLSGMDSSGTAFAENKNLTDDNNLVYIAVAECITSDSIEKIKDIINNETLKLIHKK